MPAPSPLAEPMLRVHLPYERRHANPTRLSRKLGTGA